MRDRHAERGQAAVLAALCLFTMVVFMALATNMGALASDRIRIQNTADATALAGAYAQAGRMNQIAKLNANIAYTAWYCRRRLTRRVGGEVKVWTQCLYEPVRGDLFDPPFGGGGEPPGSGFRLPVCHWSGGTPTGPTTDPDAEAFIDWCAQTMNAYRAQIFMIADWMTNYRKPTPATPGGGIRRAAYLTADKNFFKTGDENQASSRTYIYDRIGSDTTQAFSPTWRDDGRYLPDQVPRFLIPVSRSGNADEEPPTFKPSFVDLDIARSSFRYFVTWCDSKFMDPPVCTQLDAPRAMTPNSTQGATLYTWYGKRTWPSPAGTGDVLYSVFFPVKIFGTPSKRFFDTPDKPPETQGYFGATSTGGSDELSAYAVAKPYDGLIGPNRLIGDARFDAEWGAVPQNTTEPSSPVYGPGAIQDLVANGFFGFTITGAGPGGVSGTARNQYHARLMGLSEEPNTGGMAGRLARPVELVTEAVRTRREPGPTDGLPSGSLDQVLIH